MDNICRDYLKAVISSLFSDRGFDTLDPAALLSLTEMVQSFISELGRVTQSYCELAGRAKPFEHDVVMALVNMHISIKDMCEYASYRHKKQLPTPTNSMPPKQPTILQAGVKQTHPTHIPNHLPPFPDPHAYIRTPTHKKPITEYEAIREKAAMQKRDLEYALNKYMTRIYDTESLFFNQEPDDFTLIAAKPSFPPYLTALLPKDQVFDQEENGTSVQPGGNKLKSGKARNGDEEMEDDEEAEEEMDNVIKTEQEAELIDNPFLRAVKSFDVNTKSKFSISFNK